MNDLTQTQRQIHVVKASPHIPDTKATEVRCLVHNAVLFRLKDSNGNWGTARGCHFGCVLKLDSFESLLPGV